MKKTTFLKSFILALIFLMGSVSTWGAYSGTGSFNKITSDAELTDGYYVFAYGSTYAMNNTNGGSYFGNTSIAPVGTTITDPSTSIVWLITTDINGGRTIFNEVTSKYVSYTGNSNASYAVDAVTAAAQRWTFTWSSTEFTVANIGASTRLLQYNSGAPRFACYTGSQQNITLYKMASASTTAATTPTITITGSEKAIGTYWNTANVTLTSDGSDAIYYTLDGNDPTTASTLYSAAFDVTTTSTVKAIAVEAGLDNSLVAAKTITIATPAIATIPYSEAFNNTLGDWFSYQVAGAKPWVASTNGAFGNGYGGGDVESWLISPKFTAIGDGIALTFDYASKYIGNALIVKMSSDYMGYGDPSVATWTDLSTIAAPTEQDNNYTVHASENIIAASTGTVYFALVYDTDNNYSDWRITNASVVNYTVPVNPTITVTESTIPTFTTLVGQNIIQAINVSGVNLTESIAMALSGTDAALFELDIEMVPQTDGTAVSTEVSIKYKPTVPGNHTAKLTLSSAGAEDVVRDLSGSSSLTIPLATDATGISATGFTANWMEVAGATDYELTVYTQVGTSEDTGEYGFEGDENAPEGWIFTGISSTYTSSGYYGEASPSVKFDDTDDAITTPVLEGVASEISFWARGASTDEISSFLVEGFNGTDWVTIENIMPLPTTGTTYTYNATSTPAIPANLTQFRFVYTKSVGNLALDDLSATYEAPDYVGIAGSPFTISGTDSKVISGLADDTKYYYTVSAINGANSSDDSNTITVTTSINTSLNNINTNAQLRYTNGSVLFNTEANMNVEVYNSIGQKLISAISTGGLNTIPVNAKGILIVKVGNQVSKLIAR